MYSGTMCLCEGEIIFYFKFGTAMYKQNIQNNH